MLTKTRERIKQKWDGVIIGVECLPFQLWVPKLGPSTEVSVVRTVV